VGRLSCSSSPEELVVGCAGVVDQDAVEAPVELLGVHAVGAFDLAVQAWRGVAWRR
jgi:hypothetical protein